MTNDKLPEPIIDQINTEADKYGFVVPYDGSNKFYNEDKVKGYQDGATAWAGWKVKYDELQAQANRMADALEVLVSRFEGAAEMADQDIDSGIIKDCKKLLQQFKDGKEGNDIKTEPTISKCGMCHKEGVNQYLGNQFYLCDECFINYENSRDQP